MQTGEVRTRLRALHLQLRRLALQQLHELLRTMQHVAPVRDEYGDAAAYDRAEEVHQRRVCVLVGMADELEDECKELPKP